jgi:tetratricopeptide (TPR) repeat protein
MDSTVTTSVVASMTAVAAATWWYRRHRQQSGNKQPPTNDEIQSDHSSSLKSEGQKSNDIKGSIDVHQKNAAALVSKGMNGNKQQQQLEEQSNDVNNNNNNNKLVHSESNNNNWFSRARRLFNGEKFGKAFRFFESRAQTDAACAFNAALCLEQKGDMDGAIRYYERAIELDNCHSAALLNLGVLLSEKPAEQDRAVGLLKRASKLKPSQTAAAAYNNLALIAMGRGQAEQAKSNIERALALLRSHDDCVAAALAKCQDESITASSSDAEQRAHRLLADVHFNLGNLYMEHPTLVPPLASVPKHYYMHVAVKHFQMATALREFHHSGSGEVDVDGHLNYAAALLKLYERDSNMQHLIDCKRHLHVAIQLAGDDWRLHVNMGNCLMLQQQLSEALPHFHRAAQLQPDEPDVHHSLAMCLKRLQMYPEAIDELMIAARLDPSDYRSLMSLALLQKHIGSLTDARRSYEQALSRNPREPNVVRFYLGAVQQRLHQKKQAKEKFKQILDDHAFGERNPAIYEEAQRRFNGVTNGSGNGVVNNIGNDKDNDSSSKRSHKSWRPPFGKRTDSSGSIASNISTRKVTKSNQKKTIKAEKL